MELKEPEFELSGSEISVNFHKGQGNLVRVSGEFELSEFELSSSSYPSSSYWGLYCIRLTCAPSHQGPLIPYGILH